MNDETMKCGLLMEAAQTQQSLADAALQRLRSHTQDLDAVVRDEIRRTLVDELRSLASEIDGAVRSLRSLAHVANMRSALWSIGTIILSGALTITMTTVVSHRLLPSHAEIESLSARRDELALSVARLEQRGGRIDLRRCGEPKRYCVRVDRNAPAFGQQADYLVVAGY